MKLLRTFLLLVGYLTLSAAVISLSLSGIFAIRTSLFLKSAKPAEATIVNLIEHKDKGGRIRYSATFAFTNPDTGKTIQVTPRAKTRPAIGQLGEKIKILYSPKDPQNARPESHTLLWLISSVTLVLGLIWAGIASVTLIAAYKFMNTTERRR